jgi:RimJ/RimL family protein N-acetyltransferase
LPTPELRTARLLLRGWRATDRDDFAAMNADPVVMEHFPSTLDREQSDALVQRCERHFAEHGFGWWAVEVLVTGEFIGFTGLSRPSFHVPWMDDRPAPVVEVGWRLRRTAWRHGYATEAARAAVRHGFDVVGLEEIVSFTTLTNLRSQAVMERLGMTRHATYEHPVRGGDTLPSVVYLLRSPRLRP